VRKPIILPIKEPWFSMIRRGEKLEEYRELKDYYLTRFANNAGIGANALRGILTEGYATPPEYDVLFKNGYSNDSPSFIAHVGLRYGTGKKRWGAKPNHKYIILDIKSISEASEAVTEIRQDSIEDNTNESETDLSDLPFWDPDPSDENPEEKEMSRMQEDHPEATAAKEWLDDFLTIPRVGKGGEVDYSEMEKYDEYHFEKAKEHVQTLYELAVGM